MLSETILSGIWAAIGSTLGKLSGTHKIVGDSYALWAIFLTAMIIVNTWSCRCYLRSLDASANTVIPTVISSATNYIFSGIIGILLFGEQVSIQWWLGATLITMGLSLVSQKNKEHDS